MHRALNRPIYDNIPVFGPDGTFLSRTSTRSVRRLIARQKATQITEGIKLKNWPATLLNQTPEPNYYEIISHRCVICGCTNSITRHHVVPTRVRKYFPMQLKAHHVHDVLPLCCTHHNLVECHLQSKVTPFILGQYPQLKPDFDPHYEIQRLNTLVKHGQKIPFNARIKILTRMQLSPDSTVIVWQDKLKEFSLLRKNTCKYTNRLPLEEARIVSKQYRVDFLQMFKPQYMPFAWSIDGYR